MNSGTIEHTWRHCKETRGGIVQCARISYRDGKEKNSSHTW